MINCANLVICAADQQLDLAVALLKIHGDERAAEPARGVGTQEQIDLLAVGGNGSLQAAVVQRIDDLRMLGMPGALYALDDDFAVGNQPIHRPPELRF